MHIAQQAKQLRSERVGLIENARAILDKAETEKRDLNTEEQSEYAKLTEAADAIKPRYERLEEQAQREIEMADVQYRSKELSNSVDPDDEPEAALSVHQRNKKLLSSKAYHRAMNAYMVRGEGALSEDQRAMLHTPELRVQTIGTDTGGGFTTSTETNSSIVVALEEEVAMRELATVMSIASDRNIPVVNDPADAGDSALTAESNAYNEDDVVLENRALGAFKLTRLVRASEELVMDDDAGFMNLLPSLIARRFAPAEETWFVNGTGSGQPRGVMLDSVLGETAAAVAAVTADEVMNLMYSVRRPYRRRASWLMNDSTVLAIRKLKDSQNQYLWRPGLEPGSPDNLLGKPVFTSDQVGALATGIKTIAFGDFSYYWIADRGSRSVKRLVERYAEFGQVGFLASERTDGVLTVTEAVKHLIQA